MITVYPKYEVQLHYGFNCIDAARNGMVVGASYSDRLGLIFDPSGSLLGEFPIPKDTRDVSISSDGRWICVSSWKGIEILSTADAKPVWELEGRFECGRFTNDQKTFLCVERKPVSDLPPDIDVNLLWQAHNFAPGAKIEEYCSIHRRDAKTLNLTDALNFIDPFSEGYFYLYPHPTNLGMGLFAQGDQHGQWVWWLGIAEPDMNFVSLIGFRDTKIIAYGPTFHPDGQEFLLLLDDDLVEIRRMRFPDFAVTGRCELDWGSNMETNIWDSPSGIYYLSAKHALVTSTKGRLYLFDCEKLKVLDEVMLLGHEPCSNEEGIDSDLNKLIQIERVDFVSTHWTGELGKDKLIRWEVDVSSIT
jgi:hypothetical protein